LGSMLRKFVGGGEYNILLPFPLRTQQHGEHKRMVCLAFQE